MKIKKCKHCQTSLIIFKSFTVTTLQGDKIIVKGDLYCGKNCFLSKNMKNYVNNILEFDMSNEENEKEEKFKLKFQTKSNESQKNKILGKLIVEEMEKKIKN